MNNTSHFFKDKPLFGLDIGLSTIKVMQIERANGKQRVRGYGVTDYDTSAITEGVITDFESVAKSIQGLFKHGLVGEINTKRVAVSIQASLTFTRAISLPVMRDKEIMQAVKLEAEQYIPVPLDDLYIDYTIVKKNESGIELIAVAVPKKIVDSYLLLIQILGLEAVAFDTTILAEGRLFKRQIDIHDIPTVLIDFGANSADITVHDKTIIVTGTIPGGSYELSKLIAQKLGISEAEAHIVKTKYGLSRSKKQVEIQDALQPRLDTLVKETRRMIRYHEERSDSKLKIEQIITMGGGANMPGLSDYLTNTLRLPVRMCNPWQNLELGKLPLPSEVEKSMYVTVAGLSLIEPKEIFV